MRPQQFQMQQLSFYTSQESLKQKDDTPGLSSYPSEESLNSKDDTPPYASEESFKRVDDMGKDDGENDEKDRDLEAGEPEEDEGPPYSVFSKRWRQFIIFMAAFSGFFSPLSATIYFPALNTLSKVLGVSSGIMQLTITSYMIFQGLAPSMLGNLADMSGRRPIFIVGFIIYIAACLGMALQDSFAALFVLRCLQSSGSSSFVALGAGIASDVSTAAERGSFMGWVTSGMLVAPAIGPILGGILSEFLGWRAIFWFLVILAGVFLIPMVLLFPETARNVVGNGSIPPPKWNMSLLSYLALRKASREETPEQKEAAEAEKQARKKPFRFPNPVASLKIVKEKDIAMLLLYNSLIYTAFYDVTSSMPFLLQTIYKYNDLEVGLCFIPFGIGGFLAPVINGRLLDWNFRREARLAGISIDKKKGNSLKDFPLERARIAIAFPLVLIGVVAVLGFGWSMEAETSIAVPLVMTFIIGLTLTGSFNVMNVMLVDNYPESPATATAANNLCRCLLGAGGTAVIVYMIEAMGRGWCFTFIALVVLATSSTLWIMLKYGPKWRKERVEKKERLEAANQS